MPWDGAADAHGLVPAGPCQVARGTGDAGLLTTRKLLVAKLRDVESSIRGILRGFGLKVGTISRGKFEARIRELVAGQAMLERIAEPLLRARAALRVECATLHGELLKAVRADEVCRRLMTIPGVGAVVAMTFKAAVDQPERFARSKAVGAHFGLDADANTIPARSIGPAGSARSVMPWCGPRCSRRPT